mgnify:CR=1 FL=1
MLCQLIYIHQCNFVPKSKPCQIFIIFDIYFTKITFFNINKSTDQTPYYRCRESLQQFLKEKEESIPSEDEQLIGKFVAKCNKSDIVKILKSFGHKKIDALKKNELSMYLKMELNKGLMSLEDFAEDVEKKNIVSPDQSVVSHVEYPRENIKTEPNYENNLKNDFNDEWDKNSIYDTLATKQSAFITAGGNPIQVQQCLDIVPHMNQKIHFKNPYKKIKLELPSVKQFTQQVKSDKKNQMRKNCKLVIHIDKSYVVPSGDGWFNCMLMMYVVDETQNSMFWCYNARVIKSVFNHLGNCSEDPLFKHFLNFQNYPKRIHPSMDVAVTSGKQSQIQVHFVTALIKDRTQRSLEETFKKLTQKIGDIHKSDQFMDYVEGVWFNDNRENPQKFINSIKNADKQGRGLKALKNAELTVKPSIPLNHHFLNNDIVDIVCRLYGNENLKKIQWPSPIKNLTGLVENPLFVMNIKEEEEECNEDILEID